MDDGGFNGFSIASRWSRCWASFLVGPSDQEGTLVALLMPMVARDVLATRHGFVSQLEVALHHVDVVTKTALV